MGGLVPTLRTSVQPVAMSVTIGEKPNSPLLSPPSWPIRSISTKPGVFSSQSAQVRIGIWLVSSESGLVCERPFSCRPFRSGARRRSIVAGDIDTSSAAVASSMSSSPCRRSAATRPGRGGASRFPAAASSTAQHTRNATRTASSYLQTGSRVLRGGRG